MKVARTAIPSEAAHALAILQRCLGRSLVGLYLHGSAVGGGLRPASDVDLLAVIDRPTPHGVRKRLVTAMLAVSGRHPMILGDARPIELTVFHRSAVAGAVYPARCEFIYGEWLRKSFEAGDVPEPVSNPEFTLLLAQARRQARALVGPAPGELLPMISQAVVTRAIGDALPPRLGTLDGDECNVLLTLARMWRTLTTGEFVPKDVAAEWAIPRLPDEAVALVAEARAEYLGGTRVDWPARRGPTRRAVEVLSERIIAVIRIAHPVVGPRGDAR